MESRLLMNYYNEIDPFAAEWLRQLIIEQHIGFGVVDERSIIDVRPSDLVGFNQCHFFAGIGVWSHALQNAGWGDNRPVWTGSCPCQPFSVAGKQKGEEDERHLWPHFYRLIQECRPPVVFGEQVEAAIRHGWLDTVQTDMEAIDYAFGSVGFPAASVGAPHIRQRLYFVGALEYPEGEQVGISGCSRESRSTTIIAGNNNKGSQGRLLLPERAGECAVGSSGLASGVGITDSNGPQQGNSTATPNGYGHTAQSASFWSECDWLPCRDGKYRPVEPGTFPLAHGVAARVGRLRGYGNAIVAPQAQAFIEAYMSI
jgi:DNA (cytosine-5)-methyltransferase 1